MCDAIPNRSVQSRSESTGSPTTQLHGGSAGGSMGLPSDGSVRARLAYSQPRLVSLSVGGATNNASTGPGGDLAFATVSGEG
jgi:hypothetical protein